jgi:hypothetical protein
MPWNNNKTGEQWQCGITTVKLENNRKAGEQ